MIIQLIIRLAVILTVSELMLHAKKHDEHDKITTLEEKNPLCKHEQCIQIAKTYLGGINDKVNPCDNFYEYACGNWKNLHDIPKNENDILVVDVLHMDMLTKLKALLEKSKKSSNAEIEYAKKLYQACMANNFYETTHVGAVKTIINGINKWPTLMPKPKKLMDKVSLWTVNEYYMKITGETSFFDARITYPADSNIPILKLTYPESVYGMIIRFSSWNNDAKNEYTKFLVQLVKTVNPYSVDIPENIIEQDIKDVINFRTGLMEIVQTDKKSNVLEDMKISELQKWYDEKMKGKTNAELNWLNQIRALYSDEWAKKINENTIINIPITYLEQFGSFLHKNSKELIVNHIHIYFAERALELNTGLEKLLSGAISAGTKNPSGRFRHERPRWQTCIEEFNDKEALGTLYVDSDAFSSKIVSTVEKMFQEMKELVETQIEESSWLSNEAKGKSKSKVHEMTAWVGYPPWQKDVKLKEQSMYNPLILTAKTEARYLKRRNLVYISAPYLKPPMYDTNWPYVLHHGSTYFMLGHEIYHAFTDNATDYNEKGEADSTWWPENMISKMLKQRECFTNLYVKPKKQALQNIPITVEPKETQSEDIADVMGVKTAYKKFMREYYESGGNCPIPSGLEGILDGAKCQKLFFLAYANVFCANVGEKAWNDLLSDVHNIPMLRVNVPLANMPEFSSVFKCKQDAYLNTPEKCDLWM